MIKEDPEKITSDFQCFVCGAIFSTDQDRRLHLVEEVYGQVNEGIKREETKVVQEQTDLGEGHRQKYG
ncbi:MAG TPA: hypothetical protein VGQ03_03620 [Nitrososphaera sp.]|jgi:hypothetical protein|nr:hypothetical protein [Nitrososphaera sp.]